MTSQGNSMQGSSPTEFDDSDLTALDEAISQVLASEADRFALHDHIDGKISLDKTLWDTAVELGWPGIGLPEDADGLGFGAKGLNLLHRQLGRHVAPGSFMATLSAAQAICEAGSEEVKSQWLPRLASGEARLGVVAVVGTAPGGRDAWILGDETCDAALVPLKGEKWGLVSLGNAVPVEMWDRTRPMLTLDLSSAAVLAELPGDATASALATHMSLAIAADSIGGARAITEITVEYMKERQQFGRPIGSFQALKHRIADHMTDIVSGEEFVALAADAAAKGDPDAGIWARLAKARCTQSYSTITQDCLQLHGGVGFTWEFDVHMYLNRARLSELLVAPNAQLKDEAAKGLADSIRAGREPLELS